MAGNDDWAAAEVAAMASDIVEGQSYPGSVMVRNERDVVGALCPTDSGASKSAPVSDR